MSDPVFSQPGDRSETELSFNKQPRRSTFSTRLNPGSRTLMPPKTPEKTSVENLDKTLGLDSSPRGQTVPLTKTPLDSELLETAKKIAASLLEKLDGGVGGFVESAWLSPDLYELRFSNTLRGYDGWFWTAAVSTECGQPSILEVYPQPGEQALVIKPRPQRERRVSVEGVAIERPPRLNLMTASPLVIEYLEAEGLLDAKTNQSHLPLVQTDLEADRESMEEDLELDFGLDEEDVIDRDLDGVDFEEAV